MSSKKIALLVLLLLLLSTAAVFGQKSDRPTVELQALLSTDGLRPGATFSLAVVLDIKDGFHINSAAPDALFPTKLKLRSTPDINFNAPRFPNESRKAFDFSDGKKLPVYDGKVTVFIEGRVAKDAKPGEREIVAELSYQSCNDRECFMPEIVSTAVTSKVVAPGESISDIHPAVFDASLPFRHGMLLGLLGLFGLGFLLSLTPCVYPMIPVTIGYFGMQSGRKTGSLMFLAALYVLGIAITYSTLGVVAALTGGMFGSALQNPYVPLIIAAVLVALALSMFGLYEFRVPSSIAAKSQGKQGALGALLMGLLFGIVAAPCVGPVTVGMLLPVAKSGSPMLGFLTFFIFSLGMGVPLFVLATFSGAITKLPQAGMWMVSVKKVFGLLLIGAAIYYVTPLIRTHLSDALADRALPLFIMLSGLYIGWLESSLRKMPKMKHARKLVGVTLVLVGAVMINPAQQQMTPMTFEPYSDAAVAQATVDGRPVMIDFTAEWCAYCKKLEHQTFPDTDVRAEGERFVRLQADQTERKSADTIARQKKYDVSGLPTIVFLDSSGTEVKYARIVGFVKPKELIEKMRKVK